MKSFKHLSFTAGYTNIKCSCAFLRYNCAVVTLKRDVSLDASLRTSIFFSARDTYTFLSIIKKDLRKSWDIGHGHEAAFSFRSKETLHDENCIRCIWVKEDIISTIGIMSSCMCKSTMHSCATMPELAHLFYVVIDWCNFSAFLSILSSSFTLKKKRVKRKRS